MSKIKISELAKELGVNWKDIAKALGKEIELPSDTNTNNFIQESNEEVKIDNKDKTEALSKILELDVDKLKQLLDGAEITIKIKFK